MTTSSGPTTAATTESVSVTPNQSYQNNMAAIKAGTFAGNTPAPTEKVVDTPMVAQASQAETVADLNEILSSYGDKVLPVKYKGQTVNMKVSDILNNRDAIKTVNEAMNEKNDILKKANDVFSGLKTDPYRAISALVTGNHTDDMPDGYKQELLNQLLAKIPQRDRVRLMEEKILSDVEELNMSPEQKAAIAERNELEGYRKQKQLNEQASKNEKAMNELKTQQHNILSEVAREMQMLNIPDDNDYRMTIMREAMGYMLHDIRRAKSNGSQPRVSVKSAVNAAQERIYGSFKKTVTGSSIEKLIETLGDDNMDKIRKHLVEKHNGTKRKPGFSGGNTGSPSASKPVEKAKNAKEYKERLAAMGIVSK